MTFDGDDDDEMWCGAVNYGSVATYTPEPEEPRIKMKTCLNI